MNSDTTYGQAARQLKAELVDRRRRIYVVKLANSSSPYEPYALASTTTPLAIEEAKFLFDADKFGRTVFHKSENAIIWHLGRKVAEISHDEAGQAVVNTPKNTDAV